MIKWLIKWLFRFAVLAVILIALFVAFKDSIWTAIAEHRIRERTGMEARIGRFSSGVLSPVVTVENLRLYNTAEFGGTLFLDIPELHIELDPVALAQRRLNVKLMRFNLAEINVVRNEAGRTNIMSFVDFEKRKGEGGRDKDTVQKILGDLAFERIEVLNLSVGKARFIDLKDPKQNREVAVNMQNQIFKNVESEGDAYGILFMIWLRSGGKLTISPNDLARDYFEHKVEKIESAVRQQVGDAPAASAR